MPVTSRVRSQTGKGFGTIQRAVADLNRKRLLVGIPGDSPRAPAPGEKGTPPSNAVIGYAMEYGLPDKNVPARPFLLPGVEAARPEIVAGLMKAGAAAFAGQPDAINAGFDQAGLAAVASVKAKMQSGPFAPLSDRTIRERAERRYRDTGKLIGAAPNKNARAFLKLRSEGVPDEVLHDAGLAQPLLDTRSLITSIQYAIKDRGQ